eukprot:3396143-Amphidinium_carterae.1
MLCPSHLLAYQKGFLYSNHVMFEVKSRVYTTPTPRIDAAYGGARSLGLSYSTRGRYPALMPVHLARKVLIFTKESMLPPVVLVSIGPI